MRTIATTLGAAFLLACSLSYSAPLTVTIWKPFPGKAQAMLESATAAKAIHEKLGATVNLALENTGRLHYAVGGFKDWKAWAAWGRKLQTSKEWAQWQTARMKNPSSEQEENFILNVIGDSRNPVGDDTPGSVYQVFIWEPVGSHSAPLVEAAMSAKAIHEKAGVTIGINVDQLGRVHYVTTFRDWDHWASVQDAPNAEFEAFMLRQATNPTGNLVEVYTANRLP